MTDHFYKCLPKRTYQMGEYSTEAVQPEHIEIIRQWRNEQMDVLRQSKPISKAEQIAYYEKNVWPEMIKKNPDKILLSIMYDGVLKGYGGLVYLSWEHLRGEISFILDTQIANTQMDFGELFRNCYTGVSHRVCLGSDFNLCDVFGDERVEHNSGSRRRRVDTIGAGRELRGVNG